MNSQFIIIAILIMIKVVGVTSRARAENFYSINCSYKYSVKKINYKSWKPIYRCGKSSSIIIGGLRG